MRRSDIGRLAVAAALIVGVLPLHAQRSSDHDIGFAIAIPTPEQREIDPEKYEIPELAGCMPGTGSHLVDGRLPRPIADYRVRMKDVSQRISIFENGLVAMEFSTGAGAVRKRVLLPDDALKVYRDHLSVKTLATVPDDLMYDLTGDTALLRIYDDKGTYVERKFSASLIVPESLESLRATLNDLIRVMSEDREVTNPLAAYKPVVGDRLISEDRKTYEIKRLIDPGNILELRCEQEPVTIFVDVEDLHNYFVGSLAPKPN